ncbi:iron ABC transporter permease, partial [Priestia megaterium]
MKFYQLILVFAVLSILSLFVGVQDLSAMDLFHLTKEESQTLFFSRFPRLLSIIMAGMSLSICGLIMQQITRNKFVSPTTAGTMDWARLGVLISLLVFASASPLLKMSIAFIFSLAGNLLFMRILDRIKFNDTIYIPLV